MPDFAYQVLIRLAVMLPAILFTASILWVPLKWLGVVSTGAALDPRNMRTWPLSFVLIDTALFAVVFAIVGAAIGEGDWSAAIAGGVAAMIAVGFGPMIVKRLAA